MAWVFDELENELREIEELIKTLTLSDGFAEDLVYLERRRKALAADLASHRLERADHTVDADLWSQAARARRH